LTERIASAQLLTTSFLPDWSLHFHKRSIDGSAKCNILAGSSGIHVAVFEISAEDKLVLDGIEGRGIGYSETMLNVPEVGDCFSYVARPSHIDDSLTLYDWYKELVLAGALMHGFPDDYVERIRVVPTQQDPDSHRNINNWKTVDLVKYVSE